MLNFKNLNLKNLYHIWTDKNYNILFKSWKYTNISFLLLKKLKSYLFNKIFYNILGRCGLLPSLLLKDIVFLRFHKIIYNKIIQQQKQVICLFSQQKKQQLPRHHLRWKLSFPTKKANIEASTIGKAIWTTAVTAKRSWWNPK